MIECFRKEMCWLRKEKRVFFLILQGWWLSNELLYAGEEGTGFGFFSTVFSSVC